ncbi:rod shape-determining protein MreD [Lachnospiraceae bacterium NK3A20]|jgi:rod shape-determining protein MreD|nr:rod shape-determining protein MreD [Lachnospiraceae bacterium NK3A20]
MRQLRNTVIIAVVTILVFVLQCTLMDRIRIAEVSPNLLIVLVATFSFLLGDQQGLLLGFMVGLLSDIFFGPLLGFNALVYALIGFLAGKFQRILYVEDLGFPLLLIAVSDFVYSFLNYVFLFLIRNRLFFGEFFLRIALPEMIYTAAISLIAYPLLRLLYDRVIRVRRVAGREELFLSERK